MAGVLEAAWQPGRSTHGGHVEFKVTVYWRLGDIRGGTGVCTVGVCTAREEEQHAEWSGG